MSKLDDLVKRHPVPSMRPLAWLVMIIIAVAAFWAHQARLDEVAIASGEVVPQGQVKTIQHLEGGIVQEIFVREGARVKAGNPLVRLTLAVTGVNRKELQVRLDGLVLNRARLKAEARGKALKIPAEQAARRPELANSEREAFNAGRRQLNSIVDVLRERILQREAELNELHERRAATLKNLEISRESFDISKRLMDEGLTSKLEHLERTRQVQILQGDLATLDAAIPRAQAAIAESRKREKEERLRARRLANDDLRRVEGSIARTRELLTEATEQASRTEIRSPIDGVVKNLRHHTIGGVVKPGEPIMEIVPTGEKMVIEARLNPIDRGYVEEGQAAVVKITSYDFVRYGGLDGEVVHVAADSSRGPDGAPFFRVIVETERDYLGDTPGSLPITAGMQATVDIHTGDKTVLEYLIRPVLKLKHEAFRER